ncbi:hypothetical protein AYY19_18260 [Photobacterium aquimaris]|uniref:hypothetical protein n=1 Tax=Photobacterium aquimaris TaxID=512643 RepID=UPI0007EF3ADD|nr:hypothetical protein [Photobacterium aquimaris]OBU15030.1 hypothetical protein AYY19_18260 [Photobacterium aquimaris]PSV96821.1 hypothetical protein CTM91_19260 [Photobacterium aquimaris]
MNTRNLTYTKITQISDAIYQEAEYRSANQKIFKKSHRQDEANGVGCLGEVIAEYWMREHNILFKPELEKTTHDYVVNKTITVDVKTKDRTVRPKLDYDNSAPFYNHTHQRPDYFFFISLERNKGDNSKNIRRFHTAYIVGAISYQELDKVGILFLKNDVDWRNKTKFWTDCLNVEMWQLITLKETIEIFKAERKQPSTNADPNAPIILELKRRIARGDFKPRNLPYC